MNNNLLLFFKFLNTICINNYYILMCLFFLLLLFLFKMSFIFQLCYLFIFIVKPIAYCVTYTQFKGNIPSYTYPVNLNAGNTIRV